MNIRPGNAAETTMETPSILESYGRLLRRILVALVLLQLPLMLNALFITGVTPRNSAFLVNPLIILICYSQLKSGEVRRALLIFCWGSWFAACAYSFIVAGIKTPYLYMLPFLQMLTAWTQSGRAALWMTVGSIVVLSLLVVSGACHWLPPPVPHSDMTLFCVYGSACVLAGVSAMSLSDSIRRRLKMEHALVNNLQEINHKLTVRINLYAALSQCNHAIVHAGNEQELFHLVCEAAVRHGGMSLAWIGLVNEETRRVNIVASHGRGVEVLRQIPISADENDPFGHGPSGTAIRQNQPCWRLDPLNDPGLAWSAGLLAKAGWSALGALPLCRRGIPVGVLTLSTESPDGFSEDEQTLLIEMASDISFALDNFVREEDRRQAEERVNRLAFYDQLTNLPNRILLTDRLRHMMTNSTRSKYYNALIFIDLDHFKILNDTLGHDIGDALLRQAGRRLVSAVRASDTVARFGGDEFVLLLSDLSKTEAGAVAHVRTISEMLRNVLAQPYQLDKLLHTCTSSIGITLFSGLDTAIEDLLKQADLAMYNAKAAGRNTVRFFDPVMQSAVISKASMEKDLLRALEERQFTLYYQPQMTEGAGLTGVEALVRWCHPVRGMVPPGEFIPLSEEIGVIIPLGDWILETACTQLAAWAGDAATSHLTMAVNVSGRQLSEANFVERVLNILSRTGAPPRNLKLELTESILVDNLQDTTEKMLALKARGVSFSLDDFGTGYSSLSYLKQLPLEQLKIDRSFVRDILTDPSDAAIARTVVALAQSFGLSVIAEGVETEAQRKYLTEINCCAHQGYLYSRPLPVDDLMAYIGSQSLMMA